MREKGSYRLRDDTLPTMMTGDRARRRSERYNYLL